MLKRYLPKRVPSYSDTATRGDCWCLAPSPVNEDLYTRKKKKFDTLKHTTKIKSKVKFSDQKTNCFQQSMLAVAAIIDSIIESTLVPHDMRWLQTLFVRASLTATKQNHDNPLIFYSPSWEKKNKKKNHTSTKGTTSVQRDIVVHSARAQPSLIRLTTQLTAVSTHWTHHHHHHCAFKRLVWWRTLRKYSSGTFDIAQLKPECQFGQIHDWLMAAFMPCLSTFFLFSAKRGCPSPQN